MGLQVGKEHTHLGNFREQEAIHKQQKVGWKIVVELFEDQNEYGDEIDVVRAKNVMDGRRCPRPVLHVAGRGEERSVDGKQLPL